MSINRGIDELAINTLKVLSIDAIQKANSGHPGIALGAAPLAYAVWAECLNHNPKNLQWQNRDRFVLSCGHGSALLYSLLVLFNCNLTLEDLKQFRQLGAKTPGHPEYMLGIETSTGPLGQGFANAVGFAQAESILAAKFNVCDFKLVEHYTYCIVSDGDMMEGITMEASSLAGVWKLSKLIVLYDCNKISIDGNTDFVFLDDVEKRYQSMGWNVIKVEEGMDCKKIIQAVIKAKSQSLCPSLIICNTVIGYGTALSGSSKSHGSPLGDECIANFKNQINWKYEPFSIPKEVQIHIEQIKVRLEKKEQEWCILVENYKSKFPALFDEYQSWLSGFEKMHNFDFGSLNTVQKSADSTRNICGSVLNKLAEKLPNIFGGSADLASSNKTTIQSSGVYSFENRCGKNIGYGVREHAMAGIANGMQLHGGFINFVSTFFVFSDYLKGSLRMSALMNLPLLYIFTHDSIGVGEDGPTHQPVEHLTALRSLPNLKVFRPADSKETVAAFECWLKGHSAFAFCLSRQELSILPNNSGDPKKGGYIVVRPSATPKVILIATGSEVALALQAQKILSNQKICASVVSMPCTQIFDEQDEEYKQSILPNSVRVRVAIEAGSSLGWYKYVGLDGAVVGIDRFGKSGKYDEVFEHFGFLANNVAKVAEDCLNNYQKYGNTVKK